MKDNNMLVPLFKTLDKIIFGIEEEVENDKCHDFLELDTEEEFDVVRSSN